MTKSILLVGVGGQGTILASKLLTIGLMEQGYDVKMSEIHGMSQRGGSVSSQIRYGEEIFSPVIEKGAADLLVAFEKMEALRWLEYLTPGGKVIVNDHEISPMPVIMGMQEYSEDILEEINKSVITKVIKATEEADKLGNGKVMNIILLGATVKLMGLGNINWEKIIKENVKPAFFDINMKAFEKGME
jgi:indolepyruvate ferredoxin oxidoreductase beta subunit